MAGLLILSGPGSALVAPEDVAPALQEEAPLAPEGEPAQADGPPSIFTAFEDWLAWSHEVPMEELIRHAHHKAPASGQMLIPKPTAFPDYAALDDAQKRDAWQSWWLATHIASLRVPSAGLDPAGYSPYGAQAATNENHSEGHQAGAHDDVSPLGDPHSLERLWRLQAHGPPRIVLPAGSEEQMYLVTDRGVLFVPEAGAQPDWMLNLEGIAGHAEVIPRDSGNYDLVVGMHSLDPDQNVASIWVVDGDEERITFSGLSGNNSLVHWTLTDVDGDGDKDIMGIDRGGNITAIKLDGTEIYSKPVPEPELPEASLPMLPEFPVLALTRTGAEVFGDATGDGTKDMFITSFWGVLGLPQTTWVTLVEGSTGEEVWSQILDPRVDKISRVATATVTGDLNEDGLADVAIWEYGFSALALAPNVGIAVVLLEGPSNTYLAGENGALLARDQSSLAIQTAHLAADALVESPLADLSYHVPLAFTDLNGDGQQTIVTIEADINNDDGEITRFFPALQERVWTDVQGGPTTVVNRYELDLATSSLPASMVQFSVREVDGKDLFIFMAPDWATPEDEPGVLFTLGADGFEQVTLPEPIGHFDIHPQTGQRFAWTLKDDRFMPVDEQLRSAGNGTRMIMSAEPILGQSLDGGVPDILIPRTLGYFWVSGRTGAIMSAVDRPLGTETLLGVEHDGRALVLERTEHEYILFDTRTEERVGSVPTSALPDFAVPVALADVTGDGELEALMHEFGGSRVVCDPQCRIERGDDVWVVVSFTQDDHTVWSFKVDEAEVILGDYLPDEEGKQMLVVANPDEQISLYTHDGSGPVWSESTAWVEEIDVAGGMIGLVVWDNDDNEQRIETRDAADGSLRFSQTLDEDLLVWIKSVENPNGRPLLVHSYASGNQWQPEDLAQYIVVTDMRSGQEQVRFNVSNPRLVEEEHEYGDWTYTVIEHVMPGVVVGDWNGDGHADLALREGGWPSVRSLKDGSVIALGPMRGSFSHAIDLNQDGNYEVGLMSGGSLRMYAYDPSGAAMEREDPLERVDAINPDEGDNETSSRFFDGEEERSPGPGVLVMGIVAALTGGLALRRRKAA